MARKAREIDPDTYFAQWAFRISPAHRGALGVTRRQYIAPEPTKAARAAASLQGVPKKDLSKIRILEMRTVVTDPAELDFCEGDVFWHQVENRALQVVRHKDYSSIEVHEIHLDCATDSGEATQKPRRAYLIGDHELASWLRTGKTPHSKRILANKSDSEVLRYAIHNTTDDAPDPDSSVR